MAWKNVPLASFCFSDLLTVVVQKLRTSIAAPQGMVLLRYESHLLNIRTAGALSALLVYLLVSLFSFSLPSHSVRIPVSPCSGIAVYLKCISLGNVEVKRASTVRRAFAWSLLALFVDRIFRLFILQWQKNEYLSNSFICAG